MKSSFRVVLGVTFALTLGCDQVVAGGCNAFDPATVPMTASAPSRWSTPPALVERWRAGGTRETEILALPAGVVVSPSGLAAVPDFQLATVAVIGPDGAWLGNWSNSGSGPGEIRLPIAAVWDSDENLLVWDAAGSKVVRIRHREGQKDEIPVNAAFSNAVVGSGQVLWTAMHANGAVASMRRSEMPEPSTGGQRFSEAVLILPPGARAADTIARAEVRMLPSPFQGFRVPGETGIVAALSSSGRLAIVEPGSSYRVRVHRPEGAMLLCRDSAPHPLTPEELGHVAQIEDEELATTLRRSEPAATLGPIGRMFFDAEERLWVQRNRSSSVDPWGALYGAPGGKYDVFSPGGDYLGEVDAPEGARLQSALGDTIWALHIGELDEPWIVAYQLVAP